MYVAGDVNHTFVIYINILNTNTCPVVKRFIIVIKSQPCTRPALVYL